MLVWEEGRAVMKGGGGCVLSGSSLLGGGGGAHDVARVCEKLIEQRSSSISWISSWDKSKTAKRRSNSNENIWVSKTRKMQSAKIHNISQTLLFKSVRENGLQKMSNCIMKQ